MVKGINPVLDYKKKEKQKIINRAKEAKRKIREAQKKANDPKKITRTIEQFNLLERAGRLRPEDRAKRAQLEDIKASKSKADEKHIDEALLKEAEEHTITQETIMERQQLLQQSFLSVPPPPPSSSSAEEQYSDYSNSCLPYPLAAAQPVSFFQQYQPNQPNQQKIIQSDPLLDAYNGTTSSTDYLLQKPIGPKKLKKYESENAIFIPRSVKTNFIKQVSEEKKVIESNNNTQTTENNDNSLFAAAPGPRIRKLIVQPPVKNIEEEKNNKQKQEDDKKSDSTFPDDLDAFMKEIEELNGSK